MEQYEVGTVIDLYDDDPQEYIILSKYEKEENMYMLVAPINRADIEPKINYSEAFVLRVNKETEEPEYEDNEETVKEVIKDFYDNAQ